jgi:hypothetical protein
MAERRVKASVTARARSARHRTTGLPRSAAIGLNGPPVLTRRRDPDRAYRAGRCTHWIKIKNPDAPAMTRVMEDGAW